MMTACAGGVRRRVTDDGKSTPTRLVKHAFHDTDTDILADSPCKAVGVGDVECGLNGKPRWQASTAATEIQQYSFSAGV